MESEIARIVRLLNEAFIASPKVIAALINHRIPCGTLLDDTQVVTSWNSTGEEQEVGALGLMNLVVKELTGHKITAIYDEHATELQGFSWVK